MHYNNYNYREQFCSPHCYTSTCLVSHVCELHEQVKDLLELMLETKVENKDKGRDKSISTDLVVSNTSMFLVAGYETTTNLLSFTSYLLALHPDVQEKLHSEIDQNFANNRVSFKHCITCICVLNSVLCRVVCFKSSHQHCSINYVTQSILQCLLLYFPSTCISLNQSSISILQFLPQPLSNTVSEPIMPCCTLTGDRLGIYHKFV